MSDKLTLKFDPNTIEHLGVSLYSKLPSVLSELISNSWDADADNITINFIDDGSKKEIEYSDDGNGMNFDELNEKFLLIGRNRRNNTEDRTSKKGRKVIGKKG
ncbi:MAG: ATP-binding protein, partial [Flavobacterium sp.]|nr:ATP-binding protein [Flavobacterium sp.]